MKFDIALRNHRKSFFKEIYCTSSKPVFALDFCEVIVNPAFYLINHHLIEIKGMLSKIVELLRSIMGRQTLFPSLH